MKLTKRDVDDVYRLDFGSGTAPIFLSEEEMEELRAHLQAERDEALGRWRDPKNPDWVVYPCDDVDIITVLDEVDGGRSWWAREDALDAHQERFPGFDTARAYFAAHPEPMPWEKAQPGEFWILTRYGAEEPFLVTGGEFTSTDLAVIVDLDSDSITAGRRIWPEGGES